MSDLDEFLIWCSDKGHYMVWPLAENFRRYQEQTKEQTHEAITEKATGDND